MTKPALAMNGRELTLQERVEELHSDLHEMEILANNIHDVIFGAEPREQKEANKPSGLLDALTTAHCSAKRVRNALTKIDSRL